MFLRSSVSRLLPAVILISGLSLTAQEFQLRQPSAGKVVSQLDPEWKHQLKSRKIVPNKKESRIKLTQKDCSVPLAVKFAWKPVPAAANYVLEISADRSFAAPVEKITAAGPEAEVFNLMPGQEWFWRVTANCPGGKKVVSAVSKFQTAAETPRLIALPGSSNCRDVGGYDAAGGKKVRMGIFYRSAALDEKTHKVTAAGRQVLKDRLKLASEIDLRGPGHVKRWAANRPQGGSAAGPQTRLLVCPINAYTLFKDKKQDEYYRQAFSFYAKAENYPLIVHCSGGADRTGVLVFLLNALLGVSEADLIQDYELTSLSIYPRQYHGSYIMKYVNTIKNKFKAKDLQTSVEKFWLSIGVTPAEIAEFRRIMLTE